MDISMHQNMLQQQKLILSHEMQQSLKILQMPALELQQQVAIELEENPLLEAVNEETETKENDYFEENSEFDFSRLTMEKDTVDYEDGVYSSDMNAGLDPLNFIIEKSTLRQYLAEQIVDLYEDETIISICNYIIDNIDSKGYLEYSIDEIAEDLGTSVDKVEYALGLVQNFHPWGIAARDLKECLKIQLKKKNIKDDKLYKLVDEYLELLADNKIREIAKKLDLDVKRVQEYCDIIRTLEPKPARGFYTGGMEEIAIPEAYIKKIGNDLYILMNENILPRLTVNQHYKELIKKQEDKEALEYIKNKIMSAVYLIKGIENRNRTIYSILESIVDIQRKYFEAGKQYLKPMQIADIASKLELHESTVSRAIKDKYIGTPYGTVKIRELFTIGIESSLDDENVSTNQVKREIKILIDNEDKLSPMSDQDISEALRNKKIQISRRTVAKYREEMGIRSSSKRKVY